MNIELVCSNRQEFPKGKPEAEKPNSMCSHLIKIAEIGNIDKEVLDWIRSAYDNAG